MAKIVIYKEMPVLPPVSELRWSYPRTGMFDLDSIMAKPPSDDPDKLFAAKGDGTWVELQTT